MSTDESTALRLPEQTSNDRARHLIGKVTSVPVPEKVRRAGRTVGNHRVPAAAGVAALVAAAVALVVGRRRATQAKASRNRWRPGFLRR